MMTADVGNLMNEIGEHWPIVVSVVLAILFVARTESKGRTNGIDIRRNKEDQGKQISELWKHVNNLKDRR